jgi:replicative DNA helicase
MDRVPPFNTDAEYALLGSIIIDGGIMQTIHGIVNPFDFYENRSMKIYTACEALFERREKIDQITVTQELDRLGFLEDCGGARGLAYLVSICPTSIDAEYYAAIVKRLSVSRSMIRLGDDIAQEGYREEPDTSKSIEKISGLVDSFRKTNTSFQNLIDSVQAANEIVNMVVEYNEPQNKFSWGFNDLDYLTSGIYPELYIIGARPSVGKTQIMLDIMGNIATSNKKILFASAEMVVRSLLERRIAHELKVGIRDIRNSGLSDKQMEQLMELSARIAEEQIHYMPQGVSSNDIYNEALKLKDTQGLDIVFVDYLQILRDCWQGGRENKTVQVGRASKVLKSIVNDLRIPVVCASQLNRNLEYRSEENTKPKLADLRESGDIEQDADVVFLLWRDLNSENVDERNILEVKMAKNRQLGDAPAVKLVWSEKNHKYGDLWKG